MSLLPPSLERLISFFSSLPGIGPKSAQRLALFVVRSRRFDASGFADALSGVRGALKKCDRCFTYTEAVTCDTCTDPSRDTHTLCVVEEPFDIVALEHTGAYNGLYHVLHGVLSPLDGLGPEQLTLGALKERLARESFAEVIIATNPSLEGDTTAMYITKMIDSAKTKVTRIARGMPTGGSLEYADHDTLLNALGNRQDVI